MSKRDESFRINVSKDSLRTSKLAIPISEAQVRTPMGSNREAPAGYKAEDRCMLECFSV